jgi:hypothetical protein
MGLTTKKIDMKTELNKNEKFLTEQEAPPIANVRLGVVYCVFDDGNYYSIPQTIRIFNTKEKAIEFCKSKPFEKYWWDEMDVE